MCGIGAWFATLDQVSLARGSLSHGVAEDFKAAREAGHGNLATGDPRNPPWWADLEKELRTRGPDFAASETVSFPLRGRNQGDASPPPLSRRIASISLCTTVLGLRGEDVQPQPLRSSDDELIMAWNGEVFDWQIPDPLKNMDTGLDDQVQMWEAIRRENDGALVLRTLLAHLARLHPSHCAEERGFELARILSRIEGPFAMLVIDLRFGRAYYCRDRLGRRSLLASRPQANDGTLLTSVASPEVLRTGLDLEEIDAGVLHVLDFSSCERRTLPIPWKPMLPRLPEISGEWLEPFSDEGALDALEAALRVAVRQMCSHIRRRGSGSNARVAVLFSGGLDCTTLARLAHDYVPAGEPIELINVAFENPRVIAAAAASSTKAGAEAVGIYDVQDRLTGRRSWEELRRLAPDRQWRFIEVDVPYQEYLSHVDRIRCLMYPCQTVMDQSLAAALYFGARGRGFLASSPRHIENDGLHKTSQNPLSPSSLSSPSQRQRPDQRLEHTAEARVLISGLGADELLGGYSRHRRAWERGGARALAQELQLDLDRLPTRNLGRDDRAASGWARELRHPFLAADVVTLVATRLPLCLKVRFSTDEEETAQGQHRDERHEKGSALQGGQPGEAPVNSAATLSPTPAATKNSEQISTERMGTSSSNRRPTAASRNGGGKGSGGRGGGHGGDKWLLRHLASTRLGLSRAACEPKTAMQWGTRSAKMERGAGGVKGHEPLSAIPASSSSYATGL